MSTRSSGHVGLSLLLAGFGLYLPLSYGYSLWVAPTGKAGAAGRLWLGAFVVLVVLASVLGIVSGLLVWTRSQRGRTLGYLFVLTWVLLEALALWGWIEGPLIAPVVVRDPMAPAVRLWVALSIGLLIWGWAGEYLTSPSRQDPA